MATINHSSGADIIVPNNNGTTYRGLGGDDTYILSNSIAANAAITIVDTSGSNKIQLVDGLSVASTKFAADAVQLTLTNGAVVTINGASNFDFDLGGNSTAGTSGTVKNFVGFAADAGVATLPVSGSVAGASNVSVSGAAWSSGGSASYSVSKSSSSVDEGSSVTFTITSNTAVSSDTSFSWTVIGDTNGGTVDKAGSSDIDILSGTATISSGSSSTTFVVTPTTDATVEGIEGIQVSVFDGDNSALSSDKILINNTGSAATTQSFTLTSGVDGFTGRSGNDSFDATGAGDMNDYDILDGGDGVDTLTIQEAAAASGSGLIPQISNIEVIQVTNNVALDATRGDDILSIALSSVTGLTDLVAIAGGDGVKFSDVGNIVSLKAQSAKDTTTVNYDAAALAGASDSMTITVSGTDTSTIAITDDSASATSTLETVNLVSNSVKNTLVDLQLDGVNTSTLNISGGSDLVLTAALDASVATIDASALNANLTLSAAPGAANFTLVGSQKVDTIAAVAAGNTNISGGAGNDTVDYGATFNGSDTIDGGDGVDNVTIGAGNYTNAGLSSTVFGNMTNVEQITISSAHSLTLTSNISPTTFDMQADSAQILNLNDGYTAATTVNIGADIASTDDIANNANIDLTVSAYNGAVTAATDVTGSLGKNDVLNLINAVTGTTVFDANNDVFETINLVPLTSGAVPTITTAAYALGATGGNLTINANTLTALEPVTITGTQSVTPMAITTGAGSDTVALGTKSDTLTAGAGNDIIAGTAGTNTIDAGAGNDTITLGTGVENISGGAGNDILISGANIANTDTIDGGDGVDTLTTTTAISNPSVLSNVSNIEVISPIFAAGTGSSLTADGAMGGATTFSLLDDTGEINLILGGVGKAWTADTTVIFTSKAAGYGGGIGENNGVADDKVTNSANVNLTVKGNGSDFLAGLSIIGGTGTDTIELTANSGSSDFNASTGIEKILIKDNAVQGSDVTIALNENIALASQPGGIEIDATALDGSASADEVLTVTNNTTLIPVTINSGGGSDALDGGSANDTIFGNDGADIIDGNAGLDSLSGGAGNDSFVLNSKSEYSTVYGTDIIDGGAGTDSVTFTGAQNLTAANLATISNTESWTIPSGSDLTISDAILAANPGLQFSFAGNGTLSTGEDTAGASLMTTAIDIRSTAAGNLKLIGSSSDDSFTFQQTESLTADDTIDGNAGSDTIRIENDDQFNGAAGDGVAVATFATVGANVTNVEKIVAIDQGALNNAGNVKVTINSGFTGASIEIDGSQLDANVTNLSQGEQLLVANASDTKMTVTGGSYGDSIISTDTTALGADNISGGAGNDTITSGGGSDTISGGAGIDSITGQGGADSIDAGAGNDIIIVADATHFKVSGGVETVNGGTGTDTLSFTQGSTLTLTAPELGQLYSVETILINAGTDAATLTFGNQTFTNLGNSSLAIKSNSGNGVTTIDGSAVSNGSFVIVDDGSNANNDTLTGGTGDDIFRTKGTNMYNASDVITGNGGNDTIQLDNDAAVEVILAFDNITGIENIDSYTADGVSSGALDVEIIAGTSTAKNTGNITANFAASTAGSVTFNVTNSLDTILKNFTITGGTISDQIIGSGGNDNISGGGTTLGDTLTGGGGNDTISGNAGADTLAGGTGNDDVTGNSGADIINGGAGNDILSGGDGIDTIEGDAGNDTITTGAGKDIIFYDTIGDSAGNAKDTITDFTQSTLNATTGAQITAGDSISIKINAALANGQLTNFVLSDKGDVANAGEAVNSMNNSKGSFVFAKDNDVLYIDMDGDSTLNSDDYAFALTGLDSFHGADLDIEIFGDDDIATTITTLDGDDKINTGAGNDIINSGAGADIISAAAGVNTINSGAGNDTITTTAGADIINAGAGADIINAGLAMNVLTGGTGDDVFNLDGIVLNTNVQKIMDFEDAGDTVGDIVKLATEGSTVGTAAGAAPVFTSVAITKVANTETFSFVGIAGTTALTDVYEISGGNAAADLSADFNAANDVGVELMKFLAVSGTAATITRDTAADKFYIIAYDDGDAFVYHVDGSTNNAVTATSAADVMPVVHLVGVTADSLVAADFLMV
jgi:Ca2+-binding RTX toxin-like protein